MISEGMPWAILLPVAFLFLLWGVARGKNEAKNSRPQETVKKQTKKKKKPVVG
jgi:hypothetical protein